MFFSTSHPFLYYLTFLSHVHLLFNKKIILKGNKNYVQLSVLCYSSHYSGKVYITYFFVCFFPPYLFNKSNEAVREGNIKGI